MSKFITLILLTFSCSLKGQQHEIKIDAFGPLIDEFNISYEWLFNDKLGIEGSVGYLYSAQNLDTVNYSLTLPSGIYGTLPFKRRSWSFLIAAKYYLFPKPKGNNFFIGTFFQYRSKPKIEDAYFETYEFYFNEPDQFTAPASLLIGGSIGYKFLLFKKRIIIEPVYGLGIELSKSEFDVGGFGVLIDSLVRLNLGYRF